jgi:hypothetical protein
MSNYRPISLLTSFSKVFEKVIHNRVNNHIKANNILAKEQYGFRNNSSTEIASRMLLIRLNEAISAEELFLNPYCSFANMLFTFI